MLKKENLEQRRARRNRYNLKKRSAGRLRLCIARSNKHISIQLIDDAQNKTIASASSLDKDLKLKSTSNIAAAEAVGKLIAERAKKVIKKEGVVFDRGGYIYHGRVKALADAARKAGLSF